MKLIGVSQKQTKTYGAISRSASSVGLSRARGATVEIVFHSTSLRFSIWLLWERRCYIRPSIHGIFPARASDRASKMTARAWNDANSEFFYGSPTHLHATAGRNHGRETQMSCHASISLTFDVVITFPNFCCERGSTTVVERPRPWIRSSIFTHPRFKRVKVKLRTEKRRGASLHLPLLYSTALVSWGTRNPSLNLDGDAVPARMHTGNESRQKSS